MKKLILFLLLPLWIAAQTTTGKETKFPSGIRNGASQEITTPTYLTTQGTDGTQGKIPSAYIEKTVNKVSEITGYDTTKYPNEKAAHDALDMKLNISDLPSNLTLYPTTVASDIGGYVKMVTDIHDTDYNTVAVDVTTPAITGTGQLVSQRISAAGILIGQPGVFNVTTFGNIRRLSGSGTAEFYFEIYHRNLAGTETLICTSSVSAVVVNGTYAEFTASGIWDDGEFIATDRIVIKTYANRIVGGSDPVYQFQFGGATPVRTILPVPFSVVDAGYELSANKSATLTASSILYPNNNAVIAGLSGKATASETNTIDAANIDYVGIGDSITYGVGSTSGTTSYTDIIDTRLNFGTYTKVAFGGMTAKPTAGRYKLSDAIAGAPATAELVTLMVGVNDWDVDNTIGNVKDVLKKSFASLDETLSFAEAFRYNLETIKNKYPTAKIIVLTPLKTSTAWSGSLDLRHYVDVEIAIANFLAIPVIDLNTNSGIYGSSTYLSDGLHPNDSGYQLVANAVADGIISNKQSKFSDNFNNLYVDDNLKIGASSTNEGYVSFNGFKGISHGKLDIYPYSIGAVNPTVSIKANGTGIGGGFSYFNASGGRYGFGTDVDNGFDTLQVIGSTITSSLRINTSPTTSAGSYEFLTRNTVNGMVEKVPNIAQSQVTNLTTDLAAKAPIASPSFTGTPTAPTATVGTNTTQIATTAFVLENSISLNGNQAFTGVKTFTNTGFTNNVVAYNGNSSASSSALYIDNNGSGSGIILNGASGSTGKLIVVKSNGVETAYIEKSGLFYFGAYTVATLPTTTGTAYATVTDALAPTYLVTVVGGGAVVCPVFFNGTNWVSH